MKKSILVGLGILSLTSQFLCPKALANFDADVVHSFTNHMKNYNFFTGSAATFASLCQQQSCMNIEVGQDSLTKPNQVTPESLIKIGSNSKYLTAILTLKLAEKGLLTLQDPLTDYFPEYTLWQGVTIRDLLHHSSGIPGYIFNDNGVQELLTNILGFRNRVWTPHEIVALVKDQPLLFPPGKKVIYNNTNYVLAGMVLEKATNMPLGELLKKEIFHPLGMKDTFLALPRSRKFDLTRGYAPPNLIPLPGWMVNLLSNKVRRLKDTWDVTNIFHESFTWASGAVVSNTRDLNRLTQALFTGEIISPKSLELMKQMELGDVLGMPVEYGLGMLRYKTKAGDIYGHGGMTPGYQTNTGHLASKNLTLTIAQNNGPGAVFMMFEEIFDSLLSDQPMVEFTPSEKILHLRKKGIQLRIMGNIGDKLSLAFGSTKSLSRGRNAEAFNFYRTGREVVDGQDYIVLQAIYRDRLAIKNISILKVYIHPDTLPQGDTTQLIHMGHNDESLAIFGYLGEESPEGLCVKEIIDPNAQITIQAHTHRDRKNQARHLKLLTHLPMKSYSGNEGYKWQKCSSSL